MSLFLLGSAAVGACVVAACTGTDPILASASTNDGGSATDGGSTSADVGTSDTTADALDAAFLVMDAAAPPGEILTNNSFEQGSCQGWDHNDATLAAYQPPYDGHFACKVCGPDVNTYSISQDVPIAKLADGGPNFDVSFWVRLPDEDAGPSSSTLNFAVVLYDGHVATKIGDELSVDTATSGAWTKVSKRFSYPADAGGTVVGFAIINRRLDNGCFYIDRASFVPSP